jgi:hypothetical protein
MIQLVTLAICAFFLTIRRTPPNEIFCVARHVQQAFNTEGNPRVTRVVSLDSTDEAEINHFRSM